jgi:hypothetical protein
MKKPVLLVLLSLSISFAFAQGNWYPKKDFSGNGRWGGAGFEINGKAYFGVGLASAFMDDFWEWDPTSDTWTQKANYPTAVGACIDFSINGKGYLGSGTDGTDDQTAFYEYDPQQNTWTQKADIPAAFQQGLGFSIGDKGYAATGYSGGAAIDDFYQYDPVSDTWISKPDLPVSLFRAAGFTIGTKIYITTGSDGANVIDELYEYDSMTNVWTQKADFPSYERYGAAGFAINNKGYITCGSAGAPNYFYDTWCYDPATDSWDIAMIMRGSHRDLATAITVGNKAYLIAGNYAGAVFTSTNWEFNPMAPGFYQYPKDTMACAGGSITLSVQGYGDGAEYKWQKDSVDISSFSSDSFYTIPTTSAINIGYYRCIIRNAYGYDTSGNAFLNLTIGSPSVTLQPQEQLDCYKFTANMNIGVQSNSQVYYQWFKDGKEIDGATDSFFSIAQVVANDTGYYYCLATNVCGVSQSDSVKVHYHKVPVKPTIRQEWSMLICEQDYAGYQWLKYNTPISGAINKTHIIKSSAKYSVEITDDNGCKRTSNETLFHPSSIDESPTAKIVSIYPNPGNGQFTLKMNSNQYVDIQIINLLGEVVFAETNVHASHYMRQIDLSHEDAGIYLLQVSGEEYSFSERIFINR